MTSTTSADDLVGTREAGAPADVARTSPDDLVVLLAPDGTPCGTARKSSVHGPDTPLHLAFSCHVVRPDGSLLLTRRSANKRTWPSTWTNACCGHPRPGEAPEDALRRHLRDELGMQPRRVRLALPDFVYRAEMDSGIVEHEWCPVFVAEVDAEPQLDPDEADAATWISWDDLTERSRSDPDSLSPWSVEQIEQLLGMGDDPLTWVRAAAEPRRGSATHRRSAAPGQPSDHDGAVDSRTTDRRTTDRRTADRRTADRPDPSAAMDAEVHRTLVDFIDEQQRELASLAPFADEVATPVRRLIDAGGKRLRPRFVMWGHRAAVGSAVELGSAVDPDVVLAAAAVEMLHTFALLHDDVMDRSAVRRRAPAAHVGLADLHRRSGATGDSDWFGVSAAIVAGDMAFVWADFLLERLSCDADARRRVRSAYDLLRSEVVAGQYLDLRLAGSSATAEQALVVALLKSGRYTVTRPLQIGAALGGASAEVTESLRTFGDAVGIAFQLRDDVLGVFGDPDLTGKGTDDDIRDGKASLLLVRARRLASPAGRAVIDRCLGDRAVTASDADRCRDAIAASGALASVEALIVAYAERADDALHHLGGTAPAETIAALDALSTALTVRSV